VLIEMVSISDVLAELAAVCFSGIEDRMSVNITILTWCYTHIRKSPLSSD
jgi:hypothetical protein